MDLTEIIDTLAENLYLDLVKASGVNIDAFPHWDDVPYTGKLELRERALELLNGVLPRIKAATYAEASQDERFGVEAQDVLSSMAWAIQWDLSEGIDL